MNWYGIDVYYEPDSGTSPHPYLSDYTAVNSYMYPYLELARDRTGLTWPTINVTECNANADNDGARPGFFQHLAAWLDNNNNGGHRMLTFFTDSPPAPHSVTWEHVADAAPGSDHTIDALNTIQATYG